MPFDLQPTLRGARVHLRPLHPDDWDALYAVASDPLIWAQHPASDRYREEVFKEFFSEALAGGAAFAVIDAATDCIIGSSRYHGYKPEQSEIEIGWSFLARAYWGGAYNREVKHLMLAHAFKFVDRVVFLVGPTNLRSQHAMEKIGGVLIDPRIDAHGRESLVFEIRNPHAGPESRPK